MTLRLLDQIRVPDGSAIRKISLYEGDLTRLSEEHAVDLLVVSAFPNSYQPTPGTVIGALHRAGLSVQSLAANRLHDLRAMTGFWLSQPLQKSQSLNISQLACFEPATLGQPPEVVGNLFRGLFPFVDSAAASVIAMPLLASGNQGWLDTLMLESLVDAAFHWLERGLAISELKIVVLPGPRTAELAAVMKRTAIRLERPATAPAVKPFDVFLSYASADKDAADAVHAGFSRLPTPPTVFDYRHSIATGSGWQQAIDEAIQSCRSVIALLSPSYFRSKVCLEEIALARLRHREVDFDLLRPIYWRDWGQELQLWLRAINYVDCREADLAKLTNIASTLRPNY